jgi:phospholipase A1
MVFALLLAAHLQPLAARDGVPAGWSSCRVLTDDTARLACFDRWVASQPTPPVVAETHGALASTNPATPERDPITALTEAAVAAIPTMDDGSIRPCSDPALTPLSRFWELEPASDCGTFGIRGYRPVSLSWIGSDSVNTKPSVTQCRPHRHHQYRVFDQPRCASSYRCAPRSRVAC